MALLAATGWSAEEPLSPLRFAKQIEAFARQDMESPPEESVIVFVGSSSIRRWDLAKSFGDLKAINRGFGGSQISDVLHYANEVVLKYKPKKVVFFCGGNDLNKGKTPQRVAADFETFTKLLFEHTKMTGSPANASANAGDSFDAWDGYITGKNLELEPGKRIVQSWRTKDFENIHGDSQIEVTFETVEGGSKVTLHHTDVPDGHGKYEQGWVTHYLEPMTKYFAEQKEP